MSTRFRPRTVPGTTIGLVALLFIACTGEGTLRFDNGYECVERPDDPTGYLQPICQYITSNFETYPEDPNLLEIESVTPGDQETRFNEPQFQTADYDFVALSCCYTGDWAVIDVTTTEVVQFYLGDI